MSFYTLQAVAETSFTSCFQLLLDALVAHRVGIVEDIRAHGLCRARYVGLAKTHLQHLMTATAINFKRIFFWISGVPQTTTRTSQFAKLMAQSAS
jgi:transposase